MRHHVQLSGFVASFIVCLLVGSLGGQAFAEDCNSNGLDDVCDISCGQSGGPCDLPGCGESGDCNGNDVPDECELSAIFDDCRFPIRLLENTTGFEDFNFTGPPDDVFVGLGGQIVTYDFHCALVLNGTGPDFTVYEVDGGSAEFGSIDVLVSMNGVDFVSVKASQATAVNIPGDETHGSNSFARSYDLSAAGMAAARYLRIDGNGTGGAGSSNGFDLDAVGAIHMLELDCNTNGVLDACDIADQTVADCNTNEVPDSCELALVIAPDCNSNVIPDDCDIADLTSGDVNGNAVPDECELDCNSNLVPDDWDISQGTSTDCNTNEVPDDCDLADGTSDDCNGDDRPDECEPDCNANSVADECDIRDGTSDDCDQNGVPDECQPDCNGNGIADVCDIRDLTSTDCDESEIPDECELGLNPEDCRFPSNLRENTTGFDASTVTGPPDDTYIGLGGQIVTYDFHCGLVVDGPGPDFTVYEVDSGSVEFGSMGVLVSSNGVDFVSVKASETTAVRIPGDETHGNNSFARSYDLGVAGVAAVRYVRIDGNGTGSSGTSTGFDLDAIGVIHMIELDCNDNGVLDECDIADETTPDCNANGLPDDCELAGGITPDCNKNLTPDDCDIADATSGDLNDNGIPDECEVDCNNNSVPDDWDIAEETSIDCNDNGVPDECDLADGTSFDCNGDDRPDECPVCPLVEVVFVMDTSTSMNDEASALCASITQVVAELQADLIDVDAELLGISTAPGGAYSCLTDYVMNLYGTVVPGSPPPGNETLGDCPGGNEVASEDWARATSVVAGTRLWLPGSIRVVVPLSDEGPWCGNPVTDPGVDRDSIDHAIEVARGEEVIVSPITGTGSGGGVIALAQDLAGGTGGVQFSSGVPATDLAAGIISLLVDACATASDCDDNGVPDDCDLQSGTSFDCNDNDVPDQCDPTGDLNGDGYVDLTDFSGVFGCLTGPCAVPACDPTLYVDVCCVLADAELDGDVDLADVALFLSTFTGTP